MPKTDDKNLSVMALDEIGKARKFHESFPQYSKTPLAKLDHMAEYLGLGQVYVKDESLPLRFKRFQGTGWFLRHCEVHSTADRKRRFRSSIQCFNFRKSFGKEFGQATFFTAQTATTDEALHGLPTG